MVTPYFSIVIPTYNREAEVQRAIASCLSQDFEDFEVVVVDDASTDATVEVIRRVVDARVHLLALPTNVDQCPARNAGFEVTAGEWIVWVDSDHELLPGALRRLAAATSGLPPDVGRVGFMCRFDDYRVSPFPPPSGDVLDYVGHVRWCEQSRTSDLLMATRRSTFSLCRMPNSRVFPMLYHLDFARAFKEQWIPEILVLQHTDSTNRLTAGYGEAETEKRRRRAEDDLRNIDEIMTRHGEALSEFAPGVAEALGRERVGAQVVLGPWHAGLMAAFQHARRFPFSPLSLAILGLASCGSRTLLAAKEWRRKRVDALTRRDCLKLGSAVDAH